MVSIKSYCTIAFCPIPQAQTIPYPLLIRFFVFVFLRIEFVIKILPIDLKIPLCATLETFLYCIALLQQYCCFSIATRDIVCKWCLLATLVHLGKIETMCEILSIKGLIDP